MKRKSTKRVSLSISQETKAMLDSVKHTGQSYNGLLQELVNAWEKQRETEAKGGS
jgi:hypothetical protein